MDVRELQPAEGAAIEMATGIFMDLLAEAFEQGQDVDVQVVLFGSAYQIAFNVLDGDVVVASRDVTVPFGGIPEHIRLRLLGLHVDAVLARAARFQRLMGMHQKRPI